MNIKKADLVAALRSRGQDDRADWVDRQLPAIVDTYENSGLLSMLGVDPASMPSVEATAGDN